MTDAPKPPDDQEANDREVNGSGSQVPDNPTTDSVSQPEAGKGSEGTKPASSSADDIIAQLNRPLVALSAIGLKRPAGKSLEEYCRELSKHRLLPAEQLEAYIALYQQARYSKYLPDYSATQALMDQLCQSIGQLTQIAQGEESSEVLQTAAQSLRGDANQEKSASDSDPHAGTFGAPGSLSFNNIPSAQPLLPSSTLPDTTLPEPQQPKKKSPWGKVALVLWSLLMIAVGFSQRRAIGTAIQRYLPEPGNTLSDLMLEAGSEDLQAARLVALSNPAHPGAWEAYAMAAVRAEAENDQAIAYGYIHERFQMDAQNMNNYAWLLCTAKAPDLQNPEKGLALAEKAYAQLPEAFITDTLAEAHFRNGNLARAAELGREALDKANKESDGMTEHYKIQLEKFTEALRQQALND